MTGSLHKYLYRFDLADESHAGAHVVSLVGRGKRVLDVGAGPGSITRHLQEAAGCSVVAIERDPEAAALVAPFCNQVLQCDLETPAAAARIAALGEFEVIVLADVLEHLRDPWRVLGELKSALQEDGYFVVSLPHAGHNAVVAALLDGHFEYREFGLLDRTHLRFFAMRDIQELFEQTGLTIVDARFVVREPGETELAHHWLALPKKLRKALFGVRHGAVYQVVVKAKRRREGVHGLDLCSLAVQPRRDVPSPQFKRQLHRRIGGRLARALGDIAARLTRERSRSEK